MKASTIASRKPASGDSTIAAPVLITPGQTTAEIPALTQPAPKSPPTSACEDDDGMPRPQVIKFQAIAPMSAPNTTRGSTMVASMMPVPSVSATCKPKNRNAMKLKNEAQATAYCGRNTRVETMVAIEFAASCSPFRKSKASATRIRPTSTGRLSTTESMAGSCRQTCSITMLWISFATSSKRSTTFSR